MRSRTQDIKSRVVERGVDEGGVDETCCWQEQNDGISGNPSDGRWDVLGEEISCPAGGG